MSENTSGSNANRGYLYPNEKKSDRQPDFRGKGNYQGMDMLVSAWWQPAGNGVAANTAFSLSFTDPASLPPRGQPAPAGVKREEFRGTLCINARKQKPNEPDFRGEVAYKGHAIELAAWWRDKPDARFLSLALSDPNARRAPAPASAVHTPAAHTPAVPAPAAPAGAPGSGGNDLDPLDLGDIFSDGR